MSIDPRVDDVRRFFRAGVRSVQADRLLADIPWDEWAPDPLDQYERIVVVGMGKAAMALGGEVERHLGERLERGVVVVPHGHPSGFPDGLVRPRRIDVLEAGHPVPDERSVAAARRLLQEASSCGSSDLLLVLISGGGSALCADFLGDVSLEEAQATFRLLLESGADIHAMNTVRKQISRIGGGRLAAAAGDADVLSLVVSDVVGDDLSIIASGPTVPNPTTADDALDMLERFNLTSRVPQSVVQHLETAASAHPPERNFSTVRTRLLGTNRLALEAVRSAAQEAGYEARIVSDAVTGEAREVGEELVQELLGAEGCVIWGGETTVTIRGDGRGGRNQELALSAALALEGEEAVFLSGGTDGRDGPTDAAGAVATGTTARDARDAGHAPADYLRRNDSYAFWEAVRGHVVTGPTHTNVMDVQIGVR